MGNGSIHPKDPKVTEKPPKGSRIIGEGGKIEIFGGSNEQVAHGKKAAKKRKTAKKA